MVIKDHPAIGLKGTVRRKGQDVSATVIAVRRAAGFIFDRKTMKATNENFIEAKFQPDDGGRAFWSKPMIWNDK
jgi:hypothetical protein